MSADAAYWPSSVLFWSVARRVMALSARGREGTMRFASIGLGVAGLGACLLWPTLFLVQPAARPVDTEWEAAGRDFFERHSSGSAEDCRKNWDFLWDWAKRGSAGARSDLGMSMLLITPPGLNQDAATRYRHAWTFAIHGMVGNDPNEISFTRELAAPLGKELPDDFNSCLAESDRHACVKHLVEINVVADFDSYAREFDLSANAPGAKPPQCGPAPTPPPDLPPSPPSK
jgi:hypothetical protein